MSEHDPQWLRREGRRLMAKGQAMLDRADNLEAAIALGEEPGTPTGNWRPGADGGITAVARDMAEDWVSAQALAERSGRNVRNAAACLSRLASMGELEKRKQPGYPAEYRKVG
jgi:hypothetical protein